MKPGDADNKNEGGLRIRTVNAGVWVASVFVFGQVLRFGSNLVLTRLLVPDMFGVMAIVTVVQVGLTMFSDVGLLQNVVQSRRGLERLFLNTIWVVQIVRGFLLFLIMLVLSYLLSVAGDSGWLPDGSVYADPVLPNVLAVMSLNVLIGGLSSTKRYTAVREMNLSSVSLLELYSQLVSIAVMIILAWLAPNIWALVMGSLAGSVVMTILSYILLSGAANRIQWDSSAFHEIFNFGKWVFLSTIISFLGNQCDRLLLGGLISSAMLGIYSISFFLATAVKLLLEKVNALVFFSTLSEVARERPEDLSRIYYRIRWRIDALAFSVAGFLFTSGGPLVDLLYDNRYQKAGGMLEILSISLVSVGFLASGLCFLALGKAKPWMFINSVRTIFLFTLFPVAASLYGVKGAVYVIALSPLSSGLFSLWFMRKLGLLQIWRELVMLPVLFAGFAIGLLFNYILSI